MKQSGNSLMENYFFLFSKKTELIHCYRCHPGRIRRFFFTPDQATKNPDPATNISYMIWYDEGGYFSQKNPDPATEISYMIPSFSCTAWKPFERSPLEKERAWQVTKKSFSIYQKLSCTLSPHMQKDMNPNTHERVLGKQQKAENQLFELKGSFWSGNSLNEFDKRSKLAFKWDAAAA